MERAYAVISATDLLSTTANHSIPVPLGLVYTNVGLVIMLSASTHTIVPDCSAILMTFISGESTEAILYTLV